MNIKKGQFYISTKVSKVPTALAYNTWQKMKAEK
ncbi:hypothetical protein OIU79_015465 [Salix purpurea]|uniref:Uncharacterized protein n=2 Tax=Salix TaxID=40685 RepID=A0A9Q0SPY6_SALPP|nr:hypothetical protein OIU79_015465 [Salix purpurea]KAJ6709388.1 hypothetical protein OIU74_010480 [Salix koriyanagi]